MPPGSAIVSLPNGFSLWGGMTTAMQAWYWLGDWQNLVQLFLLILAVMACAFILYKGLNKMTRRDAEE